MPGRPASIAFLACALFALSACQQRDTPGRVASPESSNAEPASRDTPHANAANPSASTFHASNYPLALDYAASLTMVNGDTSRYFDNGSWQLMDEAPGDRLIALSLPESNDVTTALWRLGASRAASAVDECVTLPANALAMSKKTDIAGHDFSGFTLGDAGMSHFQSVESYRAVVDGACYAIDMIVQGINGEVYDPPRQPPFSKEGALTRLRSINDGVSFDGE